MNTITQTPTLDASHRSPTEADHPLIQPSNHPIIHHPSPSDPKIARLPKQTRDMINVMLEDGLPYHVLIEELGEAGQGLSAEQLADWVKGRYQDYLKDRQTMDHAKARMEFASDLLRELGDPDPSLILRACRVVAALQIFDAMLEHGDTALRDMLLRNPSTYINVLNSLCNLTNAELKYEEKRQEPEARGQL